VIGTFAPWLANFALLIGLLPQWALQFSYETMPKLSLLRDECSTKPVTTIWSAWVFCVKIYGWLTLQRWFFQKIMSLQTFIIYAQILYDVLIIFTSMMPHFFCAAEQLTPQLALESDTQVFKLHFDANIHWQCANKIASAYPSAYALQATMKADFLVLTTSVLFLLLTFLLKCLPSSFIGSDINLLNEHVWKQLKSMFVWGCFVQILLGLYGNLDIVTVLTYLVVWFVVELVELLCTSPEDFTKTKSWANFFTVLWKILCNMATPKHLFPHSHTLFLESPVIDNKKLAAIGFDLQDQSSEMTLKCLNILPGNCNSKNTSHHLVSLVMDVWIAALLYLQYSKQKQRQADADAQMQEQMKSLKNAKVLTPKV